MEYELILLVLLPASLFDLSRYRIPNVIPVAGLIISLTRHLELQGFTGFWPWLIGGIVPFILVYFLFRMRMFGASDGKLAAVIGSFVGVPEVLEILVYSVFAGAFLSVIKMINDKSFFATINRIRSYISSAAVSKKISGIQLDKNDCTVIPYGVALSLGTLYFGLKTQFSL